MKVIHVIFFLTVSSSYLQDLELDATDTEFDTIQFLQNGDTTWRIKTFAVDQDVHVWQFGKNVDDIVGLARENTETNYGDVLNEVYILQSESGVDGIRAELAARGLDDHLEQSESGFFFWTPNGTTYRTKSRPS